MSNATSPSISPASSAATTSNDRERLRLARRALLSMDEPASMQGRIASLRASSGAIFVDIHRQGRLSQACALASAPAFLALRSCHLGDWISVDGAWGDTRSGDRALFAQAAERLAACEPGFPTWDAPLTDAAARARPDLARASDPIRLVRASARMSAVEALRDWARHEGLREAITPMLSPEPSGAMATPFWTRSRATSRELALRVAPENALVRLLCSGFDAIYEIGPSFRNEGMSWRHHPEFLMMEAYRAGWSMDDALSAACSSIQAAWSALGAAPIGPWSHWRIEQALEGFGCPPERVADLAWLSERCAEAGCALPDGSTLQDAQWHALEEIFEPPLTPCAVMGHPERISPLAALDPERPGECLRFELYLGGIEIANGYEQLRDAPLQAERFASQARRAGSGHEVMGQDAGYLDAMRLGMPALGGFGIGIDRLCQLAFGCSIRDALSFPLTGS
jgi:lysyl-tRNA synthetase class 2